MRAREVERSLAAGGYALPRDSWLAALTIAGAVLGIATAIVIIFD